MEKVKDLTKAISVLAREVRERSEKYLRNRLENAEGHKIYWGYADYRPSVTYDGGNHPEYATNAFSCTKSVFINKYNEICLETEDCDEYEISRINWDEVEDVAMYVYINFDKTFKVSVDWDTDGCEVNDLPTIVEVPANTTDDEVADWLSDTYGWCVNSWSKC